MNTRDKFINVLSFNIGKPVPDWEFGYWFDTINRWYTEGLPCRNKVSMYEYCQFVAGEATALSDFYADDSHYGRDINLHFGFDERARAVGINPAPLPVFQRRVISEDEENITLQIYDGKVIKTRKDGMSMPQYLKYPVSNPDEWESMRKRFDPESPSRFSPDWHNYVREYKNRSFPLQLGGGAYSGFFSVLRELMGLEGCIYAFYDSPHLIESILNFFLDYYTELYTKALSHISVDYILFWEDLSFKNGPLVSPDLFRKFIYPCYDIFINKMKKLGVEHFIMDTDGNFEVLLPMLSRIGITGYYPFEAAGGMDMELIREAYPCMVIMGGIDKRALAQGRNAIDRELEKASRLLKKGGYLPYTDHMVPPDVSFNDYSYFRKRLKELIS